MASYVWPIARHLAFALALTVGLVTVCTAAEAGSQTPLFVANFTGPDRLLSNEVDFWGQAEPRVTDDDSRAGEDQWFVTSGSLFVRGGRGWPGHPDVGPVDEASETATGSSTFRAHTRRDDLGDVVVSTTFRLLDYVVAPGAVRHDWDGLQLMLRLHGESDLYALALARRDGRIVLKRKDPGGPVNGGTYTTIVETMMPRGSSDEHRARVLVRNQGSDAVEIALELDGTLLFDIVDHVGGSDLDEKGAIGVRADNLEFDISDLTVADAADW